MWLLFQFLLLPDGGKTKRGSDYSGTRGEPTAGWLVPSLESPGQRMTQLELKEEEGRGGGAFFCRSTLEQNGEDNEKNLVSAVALNQTSGW